MLCKKDVLKSLFGHFVEACNFIKKENLTSQIFKNAFFYWTTPVGPFVSPRKSSIFLKSNDLDGRLVANAFKSYLQIYFIAPCH